MAFDIQLYAFVHDLKVYALQPTAQEAVFLPALVSMLFWRLSKRPLPSSTGLLLLLGTLLSIEFSVFRDDGEFAQLFVLPGYTLVLMLSPPKLRPHWSQGFALAFVSVLTADLWGTTKHFMAQGPLATNYFWGIGGGGFADGLILDPVIAMGWLASFAWLQERDLLQVKVQDFLKRLLSSPSLPSAQSLKR